MAKEKTGQEVGATVDVKPEEVTVTAALQAEIEALRAELDKANAEIQAAQAELAAAQERNAELERLLEAGLAPGGISDGETLTPEAAFYTGSGAPAADAEVVAIKSKHGHAFFRAGYHVQPHWTFVHRADFEPADFERLIGDRMVEAREALPTDAA
jgi:hypothetical protein